MEKMIPSPKRAILPEEISSNSVFKVLDPEKIRAGSIDEGIFPDEILETIEKRRKQLLEKMDSLVQKSRAKPLEEQEKTAGIEEVKTTIRVILLEIEKLQAQTGTSCVRECDRMLQELESVHEKVRMEKKKQKIFRRVASVLLLSILALVVKCLFRKEND